MFYRNSNFKTDTYYKQFYSQLNKARSSGKREVLVNTIRRLNNCQWALKLKGDIKIQEIIDDNWDDFLAIHPRDCLRSSIIDNVEKMLKCKKLEMGMSYYECPNCNNYYVCLHTCKSSFCPTCGKKRRDKIALNVSKKIIKAPHRQLVFTVPTELRGFFRYYRDQISILFEAANESIVDLLKRHAPKKYKEEKRKIGIICFLHTYGRAMNRHPHIHVLFAEKYLTKDGELKDFYFLKFDYLRKHFLFSVIKKIRRFLNTERVSNKARKKYRAIIESVQKRAVNGSYFYGKKTESITSITSIKAVAKYIARYAAHPAISERRILKYDSKTKMVTWFYDPHEDDNKDEDAEDYKGRQYITESALKFIERLIIHINDRYFSVVRYYGFYSNNSKNNYKNVRKMFSDKEIEKLVLRLERKFGLLYAFGYNPLLCECGHEMVYVPEKSIERMHPT